MRQRPRTAVAAVLGCLAASALAVPVTATAAEKVTIVRDKRGEPHIKATSARGAEYGFAWAQMQDQAPFILDAMARAVGRSAELIGADCKATFAANKPDPQKCFTQDQLVRLFRVPETAAAGFAKLSAGDKARLKGFSDGINAYIASGADNVPSWAVPVTPQAVLAYVQAGFVLAELGEAQKDIRGGGAEDDSSDVTASNMFALSGKKTKTRKPIVQGNPHLPFAGNTRWYSAELSYPGNRIAGITFRGLPGIAMGANRSVAWAFTANHNAENGQDLYRETLKGNADPAANPYLYGGTYRDMEVRNIVLKVKTASGVKDVSVRLRYTLHGPVITDPPAKLDGTQPAPSRTTAVAATLSQYRQFRVPSQLWKMGEAGSMGQFKKALGQNRLSGYNIVAADRGNNIFFAALSRSGIVRPGVELNSVLDGSNPDNTWQGILPFKRLPQAQNPKSGYLQNANNAPWFSAPDQIQESEVPFFLRGGANTTRSRRQVQLLGSQLQLTKPFGLDLNDAERFGLDTYMEFGPGLRSLLNQGAGLAGADPKVIEAAKLIDQWPGAKRLRADKGSTAYPLFATWTRGLNRRVLGFNTTDPPSPKTQFTLAQKQESNRAIVAAYDGMMKAYGKIAVPYGELHTFQWGSFKAPINGGDADLGTLRMTNCKQVPESPLFYRPCAVMGGSSTIFNVALKTGRFTVTRPASDTDDESSPFYTRNAKAYAADRYRDFPLTDAQVAADKSSVRVLNVS